MQMTLVSMQIYFQSILFNIVFAIEIQNLENELNYPMYIK